MAAPPPSSDAIESSREILARPVSMSAVVSKVVPRHLAPLHRLLVPTSLRLSSPSLTTATRRSSLLSASTEESTMSAPQQATDTVFMVAPRHFHMNQATAMDNVYQNLPEHLQGASGQQVADLAMKEFQRLVSILKENGVSVLVEEPLEEQRECVDAVFPNNWVSFHEGKIVLYPMMAENRRKERRMDVVRRLCRQLRAEVVDYTSWERRGKFLEGTGSMVLDRTNRLCYACLSSRTHPAVLAEFCRDFGYEAVTFEASQAPADGKRRGVPVYHTNVICSVGDGFAVLCTESIRDERQRKRVVDVIKSTNKELVEIEEKQVYNFAGNCLQVTGFGGKRLLVMSTAAYQSYRSDQLAVLRRHVDNILHVPLPTIESLGGGGARCMLGEIFSR